MKTQHNKMDYPNMIIIGLLFLGLLAFGQQAFAGDIKDIFTSKNDEIKNLPTFNSITRPFVIKVKTKTSNTWPPNATNNYQFEIPTKGRSYNYQVDCDSDGNPEASGVNGNYICNYPIPGIYTISISGLFPQIYFQRVSDSRKIISIEQWGTNTWRSMANAFYYAKNLKINAIDKPNLSQVTDMSAMFAEAALMNNDISDWDVRNVTNMFAMLSGANKFNQDIGSWDVSNVTNMESMFSRAKAFNQDISNWDVSNVTNMRGMFIAADAFDQDIGNWNVSMVTNMRGMFANTQNFNQDIGSWDISRVNNMRGMFEEAIAFNQDIGRWDVSGVTDMSRMFFNAQNFNQNIGHWFVSNVTDMGLMFRDSGFDQNIANWDVSNVSAMNHMFSNSNLSTSNYDNLLNGWSRLNLQSNIYFDAVSIQYSSASSAARAKIISDFGWRIRDGGYAWWLDFEFNYPFYP